MYTDFYIIRSKNSWIESAAVDHLKKLHELDGVQRTVGMPDLHPGKSPVGAVYLTKNVVYPHIIGNDIGCGIALFKTQIKKHKFNVEKAQKKFSKYTFLHEIDLDVDLSLYDFPDTRKLGTIGSGNHFCEFQQIDTVFDTAFFERLHLDKKQIYLMVHSGSRDYGNRILDEVFDGQMPVGVSTNSNLFDKYIKAHDNALRFAHVNRQLIAKRVNSVVSSHDPEFLFESVHNGISEVQIENTTHFLHRKGAAPSTIGPIVIAGTRQTPSYIVQPNPELEDYLYSVSHGAGRKWQRNTCKERFQHKHGKKSLSLMSHKHWVCWKKGLYYEESADAYKNIQQVIDDLISHNMIKVIATLKPVLTVKI